MAYPTHWHTARFKAWFNIKRSLPEIYDYTFYFRAMTVYFLPSCFSSAASLALNYLSQAYWNFSITWKINNSLSAKSFLRIGELAVSSSGLMCWIRKEYSVGSQFTILDLPYRVRCLFYRVYESLSLSASVFIPLPWLLYKISFELPAVGTLVVTLVICICPSLVLTLVWSLFYFRRRLFSFGLVVEFWLAGLLDAQSFLVSSAANDAFFGIVCGWSKGAVFVFGIY
jgi:hypothetical protein